MSLVVVAMLIALLVYFCVMRNKTTRIGKHLLASQLRKSQLQGETTTNNNISPNKTMSLVSFDRMSPDKVMPMPYPVTEQLSQPRKQLETPGGPLPVMSLVKIQQIDGTEEDENQLNCYANDDSLSRINNGAANNQAIRFGSARGFDVMTPAPTQLAPQQQDDQATFFASPQEGQIALRPVIDNMVRSGYGSPAANAGERGVMLPDIMGSSTNTNDAAVERG